MRRSAVQLDTFFKVFEKFSSEMCLPPLVGQLWQVWKYLVRLTTKNGIYGAGLFMNFQLGHAIVLVYFGKLLKV